MKVPRYGRAASGIPPAPDELIIKQLEDHPDGYHRARLTIEGIVADVDDRFGSWQRQFDDTRRTEVLPEIAAALQHEFGVAAQRRTLGARG